MFAPITQAALCWRHVADDWQEVELLAAALAGSTAVQMRQYIYIQCIALTKNSNQGCLLTGGSVMYFFLAACAAFKLCLLLSGMD
jgi:hypothetical protein